MTAEEDIATVAGQLADLTRQWKTWQVRSRRFARMLPNSKRGLMTNTSAPTLHRDGSHCLSVKGSERLFMALGIDHRVVRPVADPLEVSKERHAPSLVERQNRLAEPGERIGGLLGGLGGCLSPVIPTRLLLAS
jgi:hypothetical protein